MCIRDSYNLQKRLSNPGRITTPFTVKDIDVLPSKRRDFEHLCFDIEDMLSLIHISKTLTASLIPVWAGCMVVQKLTGSWNASLALLTLASCLCLQKGGSNDIHVRRCV